MGDVEKVLLGGLITLAITALFQIFVNPWMLRRTRRIERWEDNVADLITLVNEEWPEKLSMLKGHQDILRAMRRRATESSEDVSQDVARAQVATRAAYVEAHDQTTRMYMLVRRCTSINPTAPYWTQTINKLQAAIAALRTLSPDTADVPLSGPDQWQLWDQIYRAQDDLSAHLEKIAMQLKPPRTHRIRRLRDRAKYKISWWRGRKERAAIQADLETRLRKVEPPAS